MKCEPCKGLGLVQMIENGVTLVQIVCPVCEGKGFVGEPPLSKNGSATPVTVKVTSPSAQGKIIKKTKK